jgi:hypothetical protein
MYSGVQDRDQLAYMHRLKVKAFSVPCPIANHGKWEPEMLQILRYRVLVTVQLSKHQNVLESCYKFTQNL